MSALDTYRTVEKAWGEFGLSVFPFYGYPLPVGTSVAMGRGFLRVRHRSWQKAIDVPLHFLQAVRIAFGAAGREVTLTGPRP